MWSKHKGNTLVSRKICQKNLFSFYLQRFEAWQYPTWCWGSLQNCRFWYVQRRYCWWRNNHYLLWNSWLHCTWSEYNIYFILQKGFGDCSIFLVLEHCDLCEKTFLCTYNRYLFLTKFDKFLEDSMGRFLWDYGPKTNWFTIINWF